MEVEEIPSGDKDTKKRRLSVSLIRLFIFLWILYVVLGITVFPEWYTRVVQTEGFFYLLEEAGSTFLYWNIRALYFIASITTLFAFTRFFPSVHESIGRFLYGFRYFSIISLLVLVASGRVLFLSESTSSTGSSTNSWSSTQDNQNRRYNTLRRSRYTDGIGGKPISVPVTFVFIDTTRIEDAYSQISDEFDHKSRTIVSSNTDDFGGKVGVKDLASLEGKSTNSIGVEDDYSARMTMISEKAVAVINGFGDKGALEHISRIDIQSNELRIFNETVKKVVEYGIEVDSQQVELVQNELIEKELTSVSSRTFKENLWICLDGPVSLSENDSVVTIEFDYVPSSPSKVTIETRISKSDFDLDMLNTLLEESTWSLKVFGQIIHKKSSGGKTICRLQPYAIYR